MRYAIFIVFLLTAPTLAAAGDPHIVQPGSTDSIEFPGHLTRILSDHHDTPAGTSILELTLPPRTFGAPPHIHSLEDEHFYVLEGSVDFLDRGNVTRASTGSLVVLPRGNLHGFWNDTDKSARLLLIISPGEFSDFFDAVVQEIRQTSADTPEAIGGLIAQAAATRGVEIHFDKVPASAIHLLPK